MTRTIRLGTRGSKLALWQTAHVSSRLRDAYPGLAFEVVVITTTGDRLQDQALPSIGGKGAFTEELEAALRDGRIDLAVHSLKDLPTQAAEGLTVGAVLERANPSDALVSRSGCTLAALPAGACVGSGSPRRRAQLLACRPDLRMQDLRGNVDTRLSKARDPQGPYDAIVAAYAALDRLGVAPSASEILSDDVMLPAPGQGAIAVECRDEQTSLDLLRLVDHAASNLETRAERSFLEALGGGCAIPVAARGRLGIDGVLRLRGRILSVDGSRKIEAETEAPVVPGSEGYPAAETAGAGMAGKALRMGATELLRRAPPCDEQTRGRP